MRNIVVLHMEWHLFVACQSRKQLSKRKSVDSDVRLKKQVTVDGPDRIVNADSNMAAKTHSPGASACLQLYIRIL